MVNWQIDPNLFSKRMADVASLIASKFKNVFYITFAFDVTQECDCISTDSDPMVSENLGIFASTDAVSVDKAVMDMIAERKIGDYFDKEHDYYSPMFEYAQKIGLGNLEYDIIEI
jgi:hypothetical protein